jgi:DNA-binding CsgD family transcriptional regulator/tetratricopeptide (TPR) repeat protein
MLTLTAVERRRSSPMFVGREPELERLASALSEAANGRPSSILVAGDAGIGKSRVVAEFLARARARPPVMVLEGGCTDLAGTGLPYEPITEALHSLTRQLEPDDLAWAIGDRAAELSVLAPELAAGRKTDLVLADPAANRQRVFEAVVDLLLRLADRQPTLLIQEDLHWADASTRQLLAFLMRKLRAGQIAVVATFRSDEIHRMHPLLDWLAEVERLPRVDRIDLAPFDQTEVAEQVRGILGQEPAEALLESVERRAGGNPFFIEELVAVLDDPAAGGVPRTIHDITRARVGRLSQGSRSILAMTAVAGGRIDELLLTAAFTAAGEDPEAHVREALDSQLLTLDRSSHEAVFAFRHALLQEAVEDEQLPGERRRLHAALARAFEASGDLSRAGTLAAIAHHWSAAEDRPRALIASLAAARSASQVYAFLDALRQYEAVLTLWHLVPVEERPPDDYVHIALDASRAAGLGGASGRALAWAHQALQASAGSLDPEKTATVEEALAWAAIADGQLELATRSLESAVSRLEQRPATVTAARVTAAYARVLLLTRHTAESGVVAERAVTMASNLDDRLAHASALSTIGSGLVEIGDCAGATSALERALELARGVGDAWELQRAHGNLADALYWCGQAARSSELFDQTHALLQELGMPSGFAPWLQIEESYRRFESGRWKEARKLLDDLPADDIEGDERVRYAVTLLWISLLVGDLERAHEAVDLARREGMAPSGRWHEWVPFLASQLALDEGRLDDAERELGIALASGKAGPISSTDLVMAQRIAIGILAELAENARAARDLTAVERHRGRGQVTLRSMRQLVDSIAYPGSPASRRPVGELLIGQAESSRLDRGHDPESWAKAAAHWREVPEPWRTAYCEFREAESRLESGEPRRSASALLRKAHQTALGLGARPLRQKIEEVATRAGIKLDPDAGAVVSERPRPVDRDPHGLTPRETEVLRLLADGLTNREIADRLFISESTAGVHVSHILGKLGVGTRAAAAAVGARMALAAERRSLVGPSSQPPAADADPGR